MTQDQATQLLLQGAFAARNTAGVQRPTLQATMKRLCCRSFAQRGVLDGPGLLASLLADIVQSLLATSSEETTRPGTGASSDAWVLASPFAAPGARENALGEHHAGSTSTWQLVCRKHVPGKSLVEHGRMLSICTAAVSQLVQAGLRAVLRMSWCLWYLRPALLLVTQEVFCRPAGHHI